MSGIIGSILGGAIAGFVAMVVVARTNTHQSKLAAAASLEQNERAEVQLEKQREALEAQLRAQKREADFDREIMVRAELISVISDFADALEKDVELAVTAEEAPLLSSRRVGPVLETFDRQIAILVQRWRMNLNPVDDVDLRRGLQDWCGLFGDLIRNCTFGDRNDEGTTLLRGSLGDLQKAAMNFRLTAWGEDWTSAGTAEFLGESLMRVIEHNMKFHAGGPGNPMYNAPAKERRLFD